MWILFGVFMSGVIVAGAFGFELPALGLAGFILLGWMMVSHHVPPFAFVVFLLPLEYQGFDLGFANIGPYDLITDLFVLVFLAHWIYQKRLALPRVYGAALVMLFLFLPSFVSTPDFGTSLKEFIRLSLGVLTAYGIYSYALSQTSASTIHTMVKLFVVESVVLALYTLYDFYISNSLLRILSGRVQLGLFYDVNFYASYLVMVFSLALGVTLVERTRTAKMFFGLMTLILFISVVLTISRAAFLSMIAVVFSYLVFHAGRLQGRTRLKFVFLTGVVLLILVGIFGSIGSRTAELVSVSERAQSAVSGRDKSFVERTKILGVAGNIIESNPVVGTGIGAFEKAYDKYRGSHVEMGSSRSAHNTIVRVLAETGLVGLGGTLAFFYILFRFLIRSFRVAHDERQKMILVSFIIAFTGYLLMSLTLDQLAESHFWVMIGLGTAMATLLNRDFSNPAHG